AYGHASHGVLRPELVASHRRPGEVAVEHLDGPHVGNGRLEVAEDVLAGHADGEVGAPVAVEVPRRNGESEPVARFARVPSARSPRAVLDGVCLSDLYP